MRMQIGQFCHLPSPSPGTCFASSMTSFISSSRIGPQWGHSQKMCCSSSIATSQYGHVGVNTIFLRCALSSVQTAPTSICDTSCVSPGPLNESIAARSISLLGPLLTPVNCLGLLPSRLLISLDLRDSRIMCPSL